VKPVFQHVQQFHVKDSIKLDPILQNLDIFLEGGYRDMTSVFKGVEEREYKLTRGPRDNTLNIKSLLI
jgi:hypothetical protein